MPAKPDQAGDAWETDSWRLSPGDEVVPGCVMQSVLGGGSRHEVYAAFDTRLLAPVVVKVVRPGYVTDRATLAATKAEIEILSRLAHPVIVRLLSAMRSGPRPHLTMERVSGRTLYGVIHRDGPLSPNRVAELGVGLASALHFTHQQGIVHLDVKPENVILGRPPRLIDFNTAVTTDRAAALGRQVGTARSAAPEQCDPPTSGTPQPASDVWALGFTLYEAINRTGPFPQGSRDPSDPPEERYPQLTVDPAPLPGTVPAPLADLIMACLSHRPDDRPTAEQAFYAMATHVGSAPAIT